MIFEPNNAYIRLMRYNWQQPEWPEFKFNLDGLEDLLFQILEGYGEINGLVRGLPEDVQTDSLIDVMVAEAINTSAIEGEYLSRQDVLSSVRNHLGLNKYPEKVLDKRAAGIAKLMLAAREDFAEDLTAEMLFSWHKMMMEPYANIRIGAWRIGEAPMQIISGSIGKEIIHFEAPPSGSVPVEMNGFINWFNQTAPGQSKAILHAAVRSAVAHLYFESIHPFEDGNGRIGRAISEKVLSQGTGKPVVLSLSNAIEENKQVYYDALKAAQRTNEITEWIHFFLEMIQVSQKMVTRQIDFTISKTRFFDQFKPQLNARQEKVLNRMFEAGPDGFEGGMQAKKYKSIASVSKATATRDLVDLVKMGALRAEGGGRSTRYELNF